MTQFIPTPKKKLYDQEVGMWDTQRFVKIWTVSLLKFYVRETFCPKAGVGPARGFVRNVACFKTSPVMFLMALGLHRCMESSNGK
jgi:hypothetical protein